MQKSFSPKKKEEKLTVFPSLLHGGELIQSYLHAKTSTTKVGFLGIYIFDIFNNYTILY